MSEKKNNNYWTKGQTVAKGKNNFRNRCDLSAITF